MFENFNITDLITVPFGWFLNLLYQLTSNYGVAIILFSVFVSLLMHPLRLMNAVSSAKKARLQPKIVAIRQMFPGDTKTQTKIMEDLYFNKEKIRPATVGLLTTIIPIVFLMIFYGIVSQPLVNIIGLERDKAVHIFELIAVLRPTEFGENPAYNELLLMQYIPQYKEMILQVYPTINERIFEGINFSFLGLNLAEIPVLDVAQWEAVDWSHIGLALLPVLAATFHVLPNLFASFVKLFFKDSALAKKMVGKEMNLFSAILMLLFVFACFQVPAAISLYWLTQSIMSMLLQIHIRYRVEHLPPEACDLETLVAPYRNEAKA